MIETGNSGNRRVQSTVTASVERQAPEMLTARVTVKLPMLSYG